MMKYAVFLRGVNVGGRTVRSAELKTCFVEAGFSDAQTVIATGNVIISSDAAPADLKKHIERFLERAFHFPIKICLISDEKLAEIIKNYPFENNPDFHRYVVFGDEPTLSLSLDSKVEAVQAGHGVVYWKVLKGHTLDSDFAKLLAKSAAKTFSTTRNLNTLEKIAAKL